MNPLDDRLVKDVFEEMVKKRPALAKYLVVDETEGDEGVDLRVLADQVIRNYPWPIGVELRRLFSQPNRDLHGGRLSQIFKTIERAMQFVAFVLTSQLAEEAISGRVTISPAFSTEFRRRFPVLSMGNFTWLIRTAGTLFASSGATPFVSEMAAVLDSRFYQTLDFWVPERNELGHYQINLTQEEIEKRCVEYEMRLAALLKELTVFVPYKLVTVREITVIKPKHKEALFGHSIDILNSSDSDSFASREEIQQAFSDSHSVLLMKDFKRPKEFLNLSPLVIDTRPEVLDTKDKAGLKKDIFMFTKTSGGRLFYVGTEVTEKCDLTPLSSYKRLQEEMTELMTVLGGPA